MWLNKGDIKIILHSELQPLFAPFGYQFKKNIVGGEPGLLMKFMDSHALIYFNITTIGSITTYPVYISLHRIEKILFNVRLPNMSIQHYYNKPFNVENSRTLQDTGFDIIQSDTIYGEKQVKEFCAAVYKYYLGSGKDFVEKNNSIQGAYLSLKKREGQNDLFPILSNIHNLFKATIIYKLMADNGYEYYKKSNEEKIISGYKRPDEWLAAYRNLCALLEDEEFMKDYLV